MTAIATVATAWDEYIDTWLDGRSQRTKPFERWYRSYGGAVTAEAMPEPWIGSFVRPRVVMLGLNPGEADLHFQGRAGLFADDIRRLGSFSRWATTDPYGPGPWEQRNGVNVYRRARSPSRDAGPATTPSRDATSSSSSSTRGTPSE